MINEQIIKKFTKWLLRRIRLKKSIYEWQYLYCLENIDRYYLTYGFFNSDNDFDRLTTMSNVVYKQKFKPSKRIRKLKNIQRTKQ